MLTLANGQVRLLFDRREFLRVGSGLAIAGFSLPPLGAEQPATALDAPIKAGNRRPSAQTCILVYLLGGPPHLDMFDLKPEAPAEYRGPFRPIPTNVPGTQICEHLPRLAAMADRYALVRSVSHRNSNHTPMIYYTLTGRQTDQPRTGQRHSAAAARRTFRTWARSWRGSAIRRRGFPATSPCRKSPSAAALAASIKRAQTPLRGGGAGFLGSQVRAAGGQRRTRHARGDPGACLAARGFVRAVRGTCARFSRSSTDAVHPVAETSALAGLRQRAVVLTGSASRRPTSCLLAGRRTRRGCAIATADTASARVCSWRVGSRRRACR